MKKILLVFIIGIIITGAAIGISLTLIFLNLSIEPRFTKLTLASNFTEAGRVFGTDVDGDGDIDVISASYGRGDIAWWENDELNFT